MRKSSTFSRLPFVSWVRKLLGGSRSAPFRKHRRSVRLGLDQLESRVTPATLNQSFFSATQVTIDLDNSDEQLTITTNGANSYHLSSTNDIDASGLQFIGGASWTPDAASTTAGTLSNLTAVTDVTIEDTFSASDTAVLFGSGSTNNYAQAITVDLTNDYQTDSTVDFAGSSTFAGGLDVMSGGNITGQAGSVINVTGALNDLQLSTSYGGSISLADINAGRNIFATISYSYPQTPSVSFTGNVQGSGSLTASSQGDVTLSAGKSITLTGASSNLTLTAQNNINLAGPVTVGGTTSLTSYFYNFSQTARTVVSASDAGNNFTGDVSVTTGYAGFQSSNNVVLRDSNQLKLGDLYIYGKLDVSAGDLVFEGTSASDAVYVLEANATNSIQFNTANDFGAATIGAGTSVTFSGTGSFSSFYTQTPVTTITAGTSVAFNGSESFSTLDVTAGGTISTTGSSGAGTAEFSTNGSVSIGGTGIFTVININAGTSVTLTGGGVLGEATVHASTTIVLGDVTFIDTATLFAVGAVTQTAGTVITGPIQVFSQTAGITLDSTAGNAISAFGGSVGGSNDITIINGNGGITLRFVALTNGDLSVSTGGNLTQAAGATVSTAGNVILTETGTGGLDLSGGPNSVTTTQVQFVEAGGATLTGVGLRTTDPNGGMPQVTPNNLTFTSFFRLFLDQGTLPPLSTILPLLGPGAALGLGGRGALIQTAGDPALAVGDLTMTVFGNYGIQLLNPNNAITGVIRLNNPEADNSAASAVIVVNNRATALGDSSLGLGTFSVTANGNIVEANEGITQKHGGGAVTFTANGAATILSIAGPNDFSGPVTLAGAASISSIGFGNSNALAKLPTLPSLPAATGSLTLNLTNAPVVLPSFTLNALSVSARGIYQAAGSALTKGTASAVFSFDAHDAPLMLTSATNDFSQISVNNSGHYPIAVTDQNALVFGASDIGAGTFTVVSGSITTAGGITQASLTGIEQDGDPTSAVSFKAFGGPINLSNSNSFDGPVSLTTDSNQSALLNVTSSTLYLGSISVGDLTLKNASGSVVQFAGSKITAAGNTSVRADSFGSVIRLDNFGNTFGGTLAVNSVTPASNAVNASVRDGDAGGLALAASDLGGGNLTVSAAGAITQTGILKADEATFTSTTNAGIALDSFTNDFSTLSLTTLGSAAVAVKVSGALALGNVALGSGSFSVTTNGDLTETGTVTQTGAGAISLDTGASHNVDLSAPRNVLRGETTLNATDVALTSLAGLTLSTSSTMTGFVELDAMGALLAKSTAALTVQELVVFANSTAFEAASITSNGDIEIDGNLVIKAGQSLTSNTGDIEFFGDVTTNGALSLTVGASHQVKLQEGTWQQKGNLTIAGTNAGLIIGGSFVPATLAVGDGTNTAFTITLPGTVEVQQFGILQVGTAASSETLTIANGTSAVQFVDGARLKVGLGATNDELIVSGGGDVQLSAYAQLVGTGLAGATATPVLAVTGGGSLNGTFANSTDGNNNPADFFVGSDIVTPDYTTVADTLLIKQGGAGSPLTGFEPDGDFFRVTASGGGQVVAILDQADMLDIVVRNATAATTITVTTTRNSGDGVTLLGGIAVTGATAVPVTIAAALSDLSGDLTVAGRLANLTVRNVFSANITAGGQASDPGSTITGRLFSGVNIALGTALNNLTVQAYEGFGGASRISAVSFGTIKATGNAAAQIAGNFGPDLVTTGTAPTAVTSVTVAGILSGTWDIAGNVGVSSPSPVLAKGVTAAQTVNWDLGTLGGPGIRNINLLGNVSFLTLGRVSNSNIVANGRVGAITVASWTSGTLAASTFGTIKSTGSASQGDRGNFSADVIASGVNGPNLAGLDSLTIAGDFKGHTIKLVSGGAGSITISGEVSNPFTPSGTHEPVLWAPNGVLASVTVGKWSYGAINAKSLTTMKVVGNIPFQLHGDFCGEITLHGAAGLGTFVAVGNVTSSNFEIESGGLTTMTVGRILSNTDIVVEQRGLGTIIVGDWQSSNVDAATIGTLRVVGTPLSTTPRSDALLGNMMLSTINAWLPPSPTNTQPAIGTFSVAGNLNFSSDQGVHANNGIGTFFVGRLVSGLDSSVISATSSLAGNLKVGRIDTLTVGSWSGPTLLANTIGSLKVTGYLTPESPFSAFGSDDLSGAEVVVLGVANPITPPTAPVAAGINSIIIAGDISSGTSIFVPNGIPTISVGIVRQNSEIRTGNALNAASGKLGTVTVGQWQNSKLSANSLGTFRAIGILSKNLAGDVTGAEFDISGASATPAPPTAVGTFSVSGSLGSSTLNVASRVATVTVTGFIYGSDLALGFATGAALSSLTAGTLSGVTIQSQTIGTLSVVGRAEPGIAGDILDSTITVLGNAGGAAQVGLGTLVATGKISDSRISVTSGNVTSVTAGKFMSSDLLVGFVMTNDRDFGAGGTWSASSYTLGSFRTINPFLPSPSRDLANSSSFLDSNVVAARFGAAAGSIALAGVTTVLPPGSTTTLFGLGFRKDLPFLPAANSVKINGVPVNLASSTSVFQLPSNPATAIFVYQGVAG